MRDDLIRAKSLLQEGSYTCVLCRENAVYTSTERGVKPLLQWLDEKVQLQHCCAADKVVGNAAAYLYVLLGADIVYAPVMSEAAVHTLTRYGIQALCDSPVRAIRNRTNTGFCPMEEAVKDSTSPEEALEAIRNRLHLLSVRHIQ